MNNHEFHDETRLILEVVALALHQVRDKLPDDWKHLNQMALGLSDALEDVEIAVELIEETKKKDGQKDG